MKKLFSLVILSLLLTSCWIHREVKTSHRNHKIMQLGELKEKGLLTEEEFQKEKNKILNKEQ